MFGHPEESSGIVLAVHDPRQPDVAGALKSTRVHFRFLAGAVAQLGERSVRNAEVVGSTPIGSTTDSRHLHHSPNRGLSHAGPEGHRITQVRVNARHSRDRRVPDDPKGSRRHATRLWKNRGNESRARAGGTPRLAERGVAALPVVGVVAKEARLRRRARTPELGGGSTSGRWRTRRDQDWPRARAVQKAPDLHGQRRSPGAGGHIGAAISRSNVGGPSRP